MQMAAMLRLFTLVLLLLSFLGTLAVPTSIPQPNHHNVIYDKHHPNGIKTRVSDYISPETFNKTAYFIVKGITGPKDITKTSNQFGSLFAFHDPFSATPDLSSEVLGTTEGSAVTSSFDGERTRYVSSFSLWLKGYKGTILNVGVADYKHSELPIVGGIGDFRYVPGYLKLIRSIFRVKPFVMRLSSFCTGLPMPSSSMSDDDHWTRDLVYPIPQPYRILFI